jgi:hypothetical protein
MQRDRDRDQGRRPQNGRYQEAYEEEDREPKAHWFLRLLAWLSLVTIFGAIGYAAPNWIFHLMDRNRPADVASSGPEAESVLTPTPVSGDAGGACTVYVPGAAGLEPRNCAYSTGGLREEGMEQVVEEFLGASKEARWIDGRSRLLNLFCSGEWLYLNLNDPFLASLKTLGKDRAPILITGLVQSLSEGFPPVRKVMIFIEGRSVKDRIPVDLSRPWSLQGGRKS